MDHQAMIARCALDPSFPLALDAPFTYAAAMGAGLSRWQLEQLVGHGVLRRPIKRVYVPGHLDDSLDLRVACLRLVVPEDCVVVDRHAGWLHGATMVLAPHEHLDLRPLSMYRPAGHGRLRNAIADSGERDLTEQDVTEIGGVRVTTRLRTTWDLGRVRHAGSAISGMDAMCRLGGVDVDEVVAGVPRFRGMRWVTTLRAIAPLIDGRSESPGESVLRLRCHECGLGGMVPQVEVRRAGRLLARLDLGDEDLMAAAEYDGAEWHSSPEQRRHDRARRADVREAGWLVEAFTAANVFGHHRDIEEKLFDLRSRARIRRGLTAP